MGQRLPLLDGFAVDALSLVTAGARGLEGWVSGVTWGAVWSSLPIIIHLLHHCELNCLCAVATIETDKRRRGLETEMAASGPRCLLGSGGDRRRVDGNAATTAPGKITPPL